MPQTSVDEYRLSPAAGGPGRNLGFHRAALVRDQAEIYLRGLDGKFQTLCEFP